jgi:hypothetical protein
MRPASFVELRRIRLYRAPDAARIYRQTALGQHLGHVLGRQWISQIPAHGQQNDLAWVVTPFEGIDGPSGIDSPYQVTNNLQRDQIEVPGEMGGANWGSTAADALSGIRRFHEISAQPKGEMPAFSEGLLTPAHVDALAAYLRNPNAASPSAGAMLATNNCHLRPPGRRASTARSAMYSAPATVFPRSVLPGPRRLPTT